jgi:hypothetical protein
MKPHVLISAAAIVTGVLSLGAAVEADETCTQMARSTARLLARQYCETIKDAYADQIVFRPMPGEADGGRGFPEPSPAPRCTRTHTLICKRLMDELVTQDRQCTRLYHRSFSFRFDDGTRSDSRSYYEELQRDGCKLHSVSRE